MDYWRREQVGASTGLIAAALLIVAAAVAGSYPTPGDGADTVVSFLTANRGALIAQAFLFGVGSVFALWFLGSLRSYLRRAEGGTGRISAVAYGGGIAAVAGSAIALLFIVAPAYRIAAEVDPDLTTALFHLSNLAASLTAFPLIVLAGAATLVVVRTRCLPAPVAVIGGVATGAAVLGTLSLFADGGALAPGGTLAFYGPFLGVNVWLASCSVALIPRLRQPSDAGLARRRIGDIDHRAEPMTDRRADGRRLEDRVVEQRRAEDGMD